MKTKENKPGEYLTPSVKIILRRQVQLIMLAVILLLAVSCKDDKDNEVLFMATLNGASESSPNASIAAGTATLTFNTDTKVFTVVVNYSGLVATAAHIHKGAVGVAGAVEFGFPGTLDSPIDYMSPSLTTAQETDLNAGLYYVNIHSEMYPAGEIRGQLIKQ